MTGTTRLAMRWLAVAALGLSFFACLPITESSSSPRQISVTLTRSASDAAVFPGRYVSVLDTAILTVTSGSNNIVSSSRVKLGQQDEVVAFSVTVEAGSARFDAQIRSNNGTLLFDGTRSVDIGPGNDTVSIDMRAVSPVLLVSLDFNPVSGNTFSVQTRVHNRGVDSLKWEIEGDGETCGQQGAFCSPMRGTLGKLMSQTLTIYPLDTLQRPIVVKSLGGKVQFATPACDLPDLVVENILRPTFVSDPPGSEIEAVIRNLGRGTAPVTAARVIDTSTVVSPGVPQSAISSTPSLARGASASVKFFLPYGVFNPNVTLDVAADYNNSVAECREDNNTKHFEAIG